MTLKTDTLENVTRRLVNTLEFRNAYERSIGTRQMTEEEQQTLRDFQALIDDLAEARLSFL